MGAYAISTGTIYLNADWLAEATQEEVNAVLTEELGHYLDGLLNVVDTAGDEGEYFARLLNGETLSTDKKSLLRSQVDAGVATSSGMEVAVENATTPIIRGNSYYANVSGTSWTQANTNCIALGGYLVTVNDKGEEDFIYSKFGASLPTWLSSTSPAGGLWIGLSDSASEGTYLWASGDASRWLELTYRGAGGWVANSDSSAQDYMILRRNAASPTGYDWDDYWATDSSWSGVSVTSGIAEIPLSLSISRTGSVKEGSGLFTTSINLTAGSQSSGNLAENAVVYWAVSGITADDLAAGSAGLTGSGTISNGKLDISHSLKQDADTGEQFSVSVYSDAARTLQIGTTSSVVVQEGSKATPAVTGITVRGRSVILMFSEKIQLTGLTTSTFTVTVAGVGRRVSAIAFDPVSQSRVTLTLSDVAPTAGQALAVSYSAAGGTIVKDLAGNAMVAFSNTAADTFVASSSVTSLAAGYKTLNLTGTSDIAGTGNMAANTIRGNEANNTISGKEGPDLLTGRGGADTFSYTTLKDSRLWNANQAYTFDRITDYTIGFDKIDGPKSVSASALKELGTIASLDPTGLAAVLTSSNFVASGAASFLFGSGSSLRTFLAINDSVAGYQTSSDAIVELTGFSGLLTRLAVV